MNRADLRRLSGTRLREAQALLAVGEWAGAYYLSGYSVECALKACIAKETRRSEFPDKKRAERAWQHDLNRLVGTAGLTRNRDEAIDVDADFASAWAIVKDWTESSRYEFSSQRRAEELILAITDPDHGVLRWLKQHW